MQPGHRPHRVRRVGLLVACSVALHLAALRLLPQPPQGGRRPAAHAPLPSVVELVTLDRPGEPLPEPAAAAQGTAPRSVSPTFAANATSRTETAHAAGAASAERTAPAPAAPDPSVSRPEAPVEAALVPPGPAPRAIDLSPRGAALSTLPVTGATPESQADDREQTRGAELAANLRSAARADVDRLHQRRELELRRDPDGTCHYSGSAIDATILPDGGVEFSDKAADYSRRMGEPEPSERPATLEDTQAQQRLAIGVKMTPRAWDAERVWFLRETEAIRRELADASHARELRSAEGGLRSELERIWCDASRSKPERRRAIFELWAGTSPDEVGEHGRAVILDYIRRNLPAGGPDAYPRAELDALAALGASARRFEPYAAAGPPDAGR